MFIGFSFFLVVAALILLALLFHFSLEKRAPEVGLLLAVGWRPAQVRRLLLLEGALIAVAGSALGVAGGILYAKGILYGLVTLWRAAVADSPLQFHVTAPTLATGGLSGVLLSTVVIWLAVRAQAGRPARELLEQGNELEREIAGTGRQRRWAGWLALVCGLGALGLVAGALARHNTADVESFFGAGSLLRSPAWQRPPSGFAPWPAARPRVRSPWRAWACVGAPASAAAAWPVVALLAAGAFLIAAVQANKLDASRDSAQRSSGTGGFAFIGESALPIVQDLNTAAGREFFGLETGALGGVAVVPLRVHDGDDASCLNLNRAQTPRLLGVNPRALQDRKAFTFAQLADASFAARPWLLLEKEGGEIPAVGDEATITWALHKKIGDCVNYIDEQGRPFKVRLIGAVDNSILQGSLLVAEPAFVRHFPGEAGYRMFLVDAPPAKATAVGAALTRALRDPRVGADAGGRQAQRL